MKLQYLKDFELLADTKKLVQDEREVLTKVLHHLCEIDRRKLYCDLGHGSLFEYAVKELKYSEGQASRRINAMRLIKEIPQVEKSIASGELSLSNVAQAQTLFRTVAKESPEEPMAKQEKISILNSLKNKSAREGQKELLKIQPQAAMPKEKERLITDTQTEIRFVMNDALKAKLEHVRSLLGSKAIHMSYSDLFNEMAELSVVALEAKKFGKKRSEVAREQNKPALATTSALLNPSSPKVSKNERYVSAALRHQTWRKCRDKCANCGSSRNLQIDHIVPLGLGGKTELKNLRLLCFNCNQRAAMNSFGLDHMARMRGKSMKE